jgi:dienelactone hydrolase
METQYRHLGPYSDLVEAAKASRPLFNFLPPGKKAQQLVKECLHFSPGPEEPRDIQVGRTWTKDGVDGEEVSWSVGYGPRTEAWVLKPAGVNEKLPVVLALHDHGGFKFYGKEKVAEGPDEVLPVLTDFQLKAYGGRAYANELARRGFLVLIHDVFPWGSRKFPLETIPPANRVYGEMSKNYRFGKEVPEEIAIYNATAAFHESTIQKYCTILGTSFASVVAYEDRVAVNYLRQREDVSIDSIGCVGLSGGGCRSVFLQATSESIRAAVVVGMMSTYEGLLDHNIVSHTYMLFPSGLSPFMDWTDLAACRAPSPLLVQFDREDGLFTMDGMTAADQRLSKLYEAAGKKENYRGEFYPGIHKFDIPMQESAFQWLEEKLKV